MTNRPSISPLSAPGVYPPWEVFQSFTRTQTAADTTPRHSGRAGLQPRRTSTQHVRALAHEAKFRRLGFFFLAAILFTALFSPSLLAQEPSPRAKTIGKRMMCMCSCNQILTECNHVGCSVSTAMLASLEQRVGRGEADDLIIQSFIQEYGQKVMAQPPSSGFGLVGWFLPVVALLIGFVIVRTFLVRWRRQPVAVPAGPPASPDFLDRARRDLDSHDV